MSNDYTIHYYNVDVIIVIVIIIIIIVIIVVVVVVVLYVTNSNTLNNRELVKKGFHLYPNLGHSLCQIFATNWLIKRFIRLSIYWICYDLLTLHLFRILFSLLLFLFSIDLGLIYRILLQAFYFYVFVVMLCHVDKQDLDNLDSLQ